MLPQCGDWCHAKGAAVLNIGVIGYGSRLQSLVQRPTLGVFDIPYRIAAVADPRKDEIAACGDECLQGCEFFDSADAMLAQADLHGIMIGTRDNLHTEVACKAARRNLPLFVEKPVAITFDQVRQLARAFADYKPPVIVSFPLRLSSIARKVRELLDDDAIGPVEHIVAWNDVPYGYGYNRMWYRNYAEAGGMWTTKATHDLDVVNYLLGRTPAAVCAMSARRVFAGDKPDDLRCRACPEIKTCPESTFNLFYQTTELGDATPRENDWCAFARSIRNEDVGNCIIEYDNGVQATYTQNFFARHKAGRRGARIYGHKGTLHFDWYENLIRVYSHRLPTVTTIDFAASTLGHFGGDRELLYDFLMAMTEGRPGRSPMSAGILSALTCLWVRESCRERRFCRVEMP
jgi:predicted dehydrogenase